MNMQNRITCKMQYGNKLTIEYTTRTTAPGSRRNKQVITSAAVIYINKNT